MRQRKMFRAVAITILMLFAGMAQVASAQMPQIPPIPQMLGETDAYATEALEARTAQLAAITEVTDDMLRDPAAADWLLWRRTYDAHGYSPLDQINRDNVATLQPAWTWSLTSGPSPTTPIVHDGVLFIFNYGDKVQALDAATGDLLWEHTRRLPSGPTLLYKRTMAIHGDKLFFASSDIHLVALDIHTGDVIWDHEVGNWEDGWWYTGGPMVVNGKLIMGMSGCGNGQRGGCFITAHDTETGAELWRFNTVARPGQPGGDSWNGLPLEDRYGGSVWMTGSYDPELNLLYYGIGQPYPWNASLRRTSPLLEAPGISNDLLYTNSTVALNPDTGALVWYYQHLANDSWDMDYAFERTVLELAVNGVPRKLVVTSGKLAIIEALDAATGEFVFAKDLGLQNLVLAIDPETGAKTLDRKLDPDPGETVTICPHAGGARSVPATGYQPDKKILYLPLQMHCAEMTPIPQDEAYTGGGGTRWKIVPNEQAEGMVGRLQAIDLESKQTAWLHKDRAPQSSASLPTGGGIVFQGSLDRYFRAHHDETGAILWQTRLNDLPNSFPVTYSVNGRQYVAVATGAGTPYARTWTSLVPDIRNPPQPGATLWVFALPE